MEKLNYNSIVTDLKSELKSVQIEVLQSIFRSSADDLPKKENLIFLILDKIITSEDKEIVFFARRAMSTILNKKTLEFNIFDDQGKLKTLVLADIINNHEPGEVVKAVVNLNSRIIAGLEPDDDIIEALIYRVTESPRTLVITFILKLLPYVRGRDEEIKEILPGFLTHKNIFVVAGAIETMKYYGKEDCLPLVANYLNSNKTILKNVSIKTIISIDKDFALHQIRMMVERANDIDLENAIYLCRFFEPDADFMELIIDMLLNFPDEKTQALMKVLFEKLDSSNFKYILKAMAAEKTDKNIDIVDKIKKFIISQFGIDEETMTFLETFKEEPVEPLNVQEDENYFTDNFINQDMDQQTSGTDQSNQQSTGTKTAEPKKVDLVSDLEVHPAEDMKPDPTVAPGPARHQPEDRPSGEGLEKVSDLVTEAGVEPDRISSGPVVRKEPKDSKPIPKPIPKMVTKPTPKPVPKQLPKQATPKQSQPESGLLQEILEKYGVKTAAAIVPFLLILGVYAFWPSGSSEQEGRDPQGTKNMKSPGLVNKMQPQQTTENQGTDSNFLNSLPRNVKINGIITEIINNKKKGQIICFMRQGNIIFKVEIDGQENSAKLVPGSEVVIKAKLNKTDALGVVHLTCKKIL